MAQTIENLKAVLEFIRRMADWDAALQYDLARAGENQEWGLIDILKQQRTYPFPPDLEKLEKSKSNITNGALTNVINQLISETEDRYIVFINYVFSATADFNTTYKQGISILPIDTDDLEYYPWKTDKNCPYYNITSTTYILRGYLFYQIPVRIPKSHKFAVGVENWSGQTIGATIWLGHFGSK